MPSPGRAARRAAAILALGFVVVAVGGCGGPFPQSSLDPVADLATRIDDLFRSIFWWAVVVFVVVEGLLVYVIFSFRERDGDERPEPVHGNALLEIGWTLAPAIILVLIAIPTIQTIWEVDRPPEGDPLHVEVVAHQWWWEFEYPDLGVQTANELRVPVGRTVQLTLSSADVIHSFWVPRIGGKRDMIPGKETMLWFTVDSAGTYPGQCAEFCGMSHALMKMELVAEDSADFQAWVDRMRQPADEPETELARQGREAFTNSACISCHTVEGTRAQGIIGPDLTHIASRGQIAAGILENTPENMTRWIKNPQHIKPGNLMQVPEMDDETIRRIVAYLQTLE